MKHLRKLLFPFAILYGIVTGIRNFLYDIGIFKSYSFPIPVIAVGNLSTGGTGKSPMTEYLIRLLQDRYNLATLSRGYKRKSTGFVLADDSATAETLGDEPYQFHTKFPDIQVAVDADRVKGVTQLLSLLQKPEVIVLDDAYQHRRLKAGFYILLTAYGDIYADDYILPAGNLRESRGGARRADVIVVTKCPQNLPVHEQERIKQRLKPQPGQQVYFSYIDYDDTLYAESKQLKVADVLSSPKILVAGIAKPQPFFSYLQGKESECRAYPDHHDFSDKEIEELKSLSQNHIIITTEKDYMRLQGKLSGNKLFYLPIKCSFIADSTLFNDVILRYVNQEA